MKRFAALFCLALVFGSAQASDDVVLIGSTQDTSIFVMVDEGNAPTTNKHGVTVVNAIAANSETRNGHLAGSAVRLLFVFECDKQILKSAVAATRKAAGEPVINRDEDEVIEQLNGTPFAPIRPDTVGAAIGDYGCTYVAKGTVPGQGEPQAAPKRKPEVVTF